MSGLVRRQRKTCGFLWEIRSFPVRGLSVHNTDTGKHAISARMRYPTLQNVLTAKLRRWLAAAEQSFGAWSMKLRTCAAELRWRNAKTARKAVRHELSATDARQLSRKAVRHE